MKIYRYVSQDELDEIKEKKVFRLWDPKKWGKNEGVISRILEKIDVENNNKIIDLIESTAAINNLDLNSNYYGITKFYDESLDKVYCDIYTEILHYYKLCITSFCQCWTTSEKDFNIKLDNYSKYVARIEAETFEQQIVTLNNNYEKDWIFRFSKVNYRNYSYSENVNEIIKNFNNNGRKFTYFIKTLQEKHSDQNEIRLTATLDDLNIYGSKLVFPWYKYYDRDFNLDDLANDLHEMALDLMENYDNFCFYDVNDRYIHYKIPENFIKDIKYL